MAAMISAVGPVTAVPAVHEEMHDHAQQQEQKRPRPEEMSAVLKHQEQRRDGEEDAQRDPERRGQERTLASPLAHRVIVLLHWWTSISSAAKHGLTAPDPTHSMAMWRAVAMVMVMVVFVVTIH
jgi:hypothetical protein